ncbi:uncharacterized protein LOC121106783 isoform X2 [Gallus gallus]|uniref:uncharacterized protein LOC121106783 isoform X2 n=1 Tax=Gallus gallus TaxID=9031 RepID=UPI001AE8EE01|nr:uncharacterized protein LOC121106783 isoform X2 [Gallus gallus]
MARVWGATAPARLVLLLLLMSLRSWEICAAPLPVQGADDDIGAPYSDDSLNPGFVPRGQPRGPLAQSAQQSPVPEPGVDSRGVTGNEGAPASPLSSRTETPADHMEVPPGRALLVSRLLPAMETSWNPMGPQRGNRGKDTSRRGKYSQRSSHILKELLKKMEMAAYGGTKGTDQETVQKEPLQESSSDTRPVSDRKTQAEQAAGLPGVDVGKITTAAVGEELRKHHIPVIAVVSAVLLSVLMLACVPMLWMWKKYLARKTERTAARQAHPETDWERDQNRDEGRAELGEAAKEDVLNQGKIISRAFSWSFEAKFAYLCSRIFTDPSLQPMHRRSAPINPISSLNTCTSQDSPEPSSAPVTGAKKARVH